ncbi:hypothetical protein HELRODRAFT_182802 [Helobdella robusta]|uniref:Uncharacterized protein n=1 Tax=Helobdella robusta TaxID=6412 RepID=T1FIR9_HELRO|nr:hypothetical protein HELRODRAFT_182802 [Helobdella robusta]ESN90108.1 hypothetical protein HELRODRAFT_182802 [Helobdella robusta]
MQILNIDIGRFPESATTTRVDSDLYFFIHIPLTTYVTKFILYDIISFPIPIQVSPHRLEINNLPRFFQLFTAGQAAGKKRTQSEKILHAEAIDNWFHGQQLPKSPDVETTADRRLKRRMELRPYIGRSESGEFQEFPQDRIETQTYEGRLHPTT